ncbi:ATP-binding cassette domain-containing protein, partial [Klebsiella pneumoniae]|uniref:ATP-binding cassette domain-containing protein n=1 Tax=Klebsiella pneumoniae TaxID=573 RepID=UPI0027309DBA
TFLRCLNGLEEFDSGSVSIDGLQLADPKTDVNAYRREVGMVFQHFNLWSHMSVLENITMAPRRVLGCSKKDAEDRARRYLDKVGLPARVA